MGDIRDSDHPYYCAEGNYYKNGMHTEHESWADFIAKVGTWDEDYNAVFRWDWKRPDPSNYEGEPMPGETLHVYWIGQRKANMWSTECPVTEADEPAVRAWLATRAEHMRRLWAPLLDAPQS